MAVSRRLRYEVMRRDDHTCRYCGAKAPDVKLTVDHVVPIALGGSDKPDNLVTACADCNSGKSSSSPDAAIVADVADMAVRWASAQKVVMERFTRDRKALGKAIRKFDQEWLRWTDTETGEVIHRDEGWQESVEMWLGRGFHIDDLVSFVPKAMRSRAITTEKWRYLCGIVWRTLDDLEDDVRGALGEEPSETPVPITTVAPLPPPRNPQSFTVDYDGHHVLYWLHTITWGNHALPIRRVAATLADYWYLSGGEPIEQEAIEEYWDGGPAELAIGLASLRREGHLIFDEDNRIVLIDASSLDDIPVVRSA